jgi:hypothetical protein
MSIREGRAAAIAAEPLFKHRDSPGVEPPLCDWLKAARRRLSADISFVSARKKRGFCRLRGWEAQVLEAAG